MIFRDIEKDTAFDILKGKKRKREKAESKKAEKETEGRKQGSRKSKIHYFCDTIMNTMKNDLTPNSQPQTYYAGFHLSFVIRNFSFVISSQRTTGWDAMFTFSGKERDQETGYSYFGARYYDSDLSIWLSVDPMASKYPSLSPYVYCANNPVKLVDPDGRDIYVFNEDGSYSGEKIKQKGEHVGRINGKDGADAINFRFADPKNDSKAIDEGAITQAVVVSNESINDVLVNSGVYKECNQNNKYGYILNESSVQRGGNMDYVISVV